MPYSPSLPGSSSGTGRRILGASNSGAPHGDGSAVLMQFPSAEIQSADVVNGERLVRLADVHLFSTESYRKDKGLPLSPEQTAVIEGQSQEQADRLRKARVVAIAVDKPEVEALHATLRDLARHGSLMAVIVHNGDDQRSVRVLQALLVEFPSLHVFVAASSFDHPRGHLLPIGIQNTRWHKEGPDVYAAATGLAFEGRQLQFCAPPMSAGTNVKRGILLGLAKEGGATMLDGTTPDGFGASMARCRLVFSPDGNQPDCHRTWQALYAGCGIVLERTEFAALLRKTAPGAQVWTMDTTQAPFQDVPSFVEQLHDPRRTMPWLRMQWWANTMLSVRDGNPGPALLLAVGFVAANDGAAIVASASRYDGRSSAIRLLCASQASCQGLEESVPADASPSGEGDRQGAAQGKDESAQSGGDGRRQSDGVSAVPAEIEGVPLMGPPGAEGAEYRAVADALAVLKPTEATERCVVLRELGWSLRDRRPELRAWGTRLGFGFQEGALAVACDFEPSASLELLAGVLARYGSDGQLPPDVLVFQA